MQGVDGTPQSMFFRWVPYKTTITSGAQTCHLLLTHYMLIPKKVVKPVRPPKSTLTLATEPKRWGRSAERSRLGLLSFLRNQLLVSVDSLKEQLESNSRGPMASA